MSPAITFDCYAYVGPLIAAGIEESQARAHADALDAALRDSVATKAELENVKRRIEAKIETTAAGLTAVISDSKIDVLRWLVVIQAALGGLLLAAQRYRLRCVSSRFEVVLAHLTALRGQVS